MTTMLPAPQDELVPARENPSTTSADYDAMIEDWTMIADIRAGARRIKAAGEKYLPRYERETTPSYKFRLACTPWRPEFVDALRNLCSKPFTKKVSVDPSAPDIIQGKLVGDEGEQKREGGFVDDVDGMGNNLHVFAANMFTEGVANGLSLVYVTFPVTEPMMTVAAEKAANVRPYWSLIDARDVIALYTIKVGSREVVQHIRMLETSVERDGFAEVVKERIRVIELDASGAPVWFLYEHQRNLTTGLMRWNLVDQGQIIGVKQIPIALFFTGERSGYYRVKPPLVDLATMQIELYRAWSRKEEILTYAGSPMLKAKGQVPPEPIVQIGQDGRERASPVSQVTVGPKSILYAPPSMDAGSQPDWDFIQPNAANIKEIRDDIVTTTGDFRRLGLQPSTELTGRVTATAAAIDAAKTHSAVEVWANGAADALSQAMGFTAEWLNLPDVINVQVHTDFGIDFDEASSLQFLTDMRKGKDLSGKGLRREAARRDILGPDFDEDRNAIELAEEVDELEPEQQIDPVTGRPLAPAPAAPDKTKTPPATTT